MNLRYTELELVLSTSIITCYFQSCSATETYIVPYDYSILIDAYPNGIESNQYVTYLTILTHHGISCQICIYASIRILFHSWKLHHIDSPQWEELDVWQMNSNLVFERTLCTVCVMKAISLVCRCRTVRKKTF